MWNNNCFFFVLFVFVCFCLFLFVFGFSSNVAVVARPHSLQRTHTAHLTEAI